MDIKLKDMQAFLVIVETGSLSKAAELLYTTPPVLSRLITRIERDLNATLFNRDNYPWKLTYAGELFVIKSKVILGVEKKFLKDLDDISRNEKGCFSLGLMPFEERYIIPPIIAQYNNKYPNFKLDLISVLPMNIEAAILNKGIDCGLIVSPPVNKGIEYVNLKELDIFVAVPPSNPLTKDYDFSIKNYDFPEIEANLLAKENFITTKPSFFLYNQTIDFCNQHGFEPKIAFKTDYMHTSIGLVKSHCGICLVFHDAIEFNALHSKQIAYFKIKNTTIKQTIAFAYRNDHKLSIAEEHFLKLLKESSL